LLALRHPLKPGERLGAAEIADSIAVVAENFRSRLGRTLDKSDDSAWHVGSIEVAFGVAVQAEAGVVIAKATAGATFSAKLILQSHQD
jgi:Trypsin-co-occurring domain 1